MDITPDSTFEFRYVNAKNGRSQCPICKHPIDVSFVQYTIPYDVCSKCSTYPDTIIYIISNIKE